MILTIFLAAIIGGTLGLLGVGDPFLLCPCLPMALDCRQRPPLQRRCLLLAQPPCSHWSRMRRELVAWRVGVIFAATAMVGAYAGGLAADWFEGRTLLLLFAAMMVLTALAMLKRRPARDVVKRDRLPWALVALEGIGVEGRRDLLVLVVGFLLCPHWCFLGECPSSEPWAPP